MTDTPPDRTPEAWTAGASGYEAAFAPFTGAYADEALNLTGVAEGTRVLDVAAGSGALSLRAARLGAEVLATDFAPGMVDLLRTRFAEEGFGRATAEVMDGQALSVDDASFDASFSMFGVIFFPDMAAGLGELARSARAGGSVCVATWRLEGFRMFDLVGAALAQALPGFELPSDPPVWASVGDADGLGASLEAAGLDDIVIHTVTRHFDPADPADFFRRMPDWSPPIKPLFASLPDETVEVAAQAFAEVVADADDGGRGVPTDALLGVGRGTS